MAIEIAHSPTIVEVQHLGQVDDSNSIERALLDADTAAAGGV